MKTALLHLEGKRIDQLIEGLEHPLESREYRFRILTEDFKSTGESVISKVQEIVRSMEHWEAEKNNYEGIRVRCKQEKAWFLLRMSLHDPVMPLNIESNIKGGVDLFITINR